MKLLTYPDKALDSSKLWHICKGLGIELTNDIDCDFDRAIYWNMNTISVPDEKIRTVPNVINIRCTNVSKDLVDDTWCKVAGYTISVDPEKFKYRYVRKSKLQYRNHLGVRHDGVIFKHNQKPDDRYVYQRLVNTKTELGYAAIRVPVFKDGIPCLVIKYNQHKFRNRGCTVEVIPQAPIDSQFYVMRDEFPDWISTEELRWLRRFCKLIGADFAEIDMIRDVETKMIYAIDVNNLSGKGFFEGYGDMSKNIQKMFIKSFKQYLL